MLMTFLPEWSAELLFFTFWTLGFFDFVEVQAIALGWGALHTSC